MTRAQKMAAAIAVTFVSPLSQYLPEDKNNSHQEVLNNWKLMKHTAVKRKEPSPVRATPETPGPPPAKRQKVEVKDTGEPLKKIGQLKSKARILSEDPSLESSKKKKKKKKKMDREMNAETAEEFTPYDYSNINMKMFDEGKVKRRKDVFDPNAGMSKKGKGKKVYKPQFSTAKSQKSSSFGKTDKSQKTQIWPK